MNHQSTRLMAGERDCSIWVGDLTPDVDDLQLYKFFADRFNTVRTAKGNLTNFLYKYHSFYYGIFYIIYSIALNSRPPFQPCYSLSPAESTKIGHNFGRRKVPEVPRSASLIQENLKICSLSVLTHKVCLRT